MATLSSILAWRIAWTEELQSVASVFPLSETGVLGDFWGRIKGAKYRFAFQDGTWAKSLQLWLTLCDPIDGSPPGSLSLGFSRQENWSG